MLQKVQESSIGRRHFIGGSDARIIMGQDEKALIRLWQEKRGEVATAITFSLPCEIAPRRHRRFPQ